MGPGRGVQPARAVFTTRTGGAEAGAWLRADPRMRALDPETEPGTRQPTRYLGPLMQKKATRTSSVRETRVKCRLFVSGAPENLSLTYKSHVVSPSDILPLPFSNAEAMEVGTRDPPRKSAFRIGKCAARGVGFKVG